MMGEERMAGRDAASTNLIDLLGLAGEEESIGGGEEMPSPRRAQ